MSACVHALIELFRSLEVIAVINLLSTGLRMQNRLRMRAMCQSNNAEVLACQNKLE